MTKKERALAVVERLKERYPLSDCTLEYDEPYRLLIAVRLAAQCTDARVNQITPILFARFPTLASLAEADPQAGACPVQGNLDPALLAAPWPILAEELDAVLAAGRAAPGHVVNLGHGVPPATDADVLTRIVARVHGSADWESVALAGWEA